MNVLEAIRECARADLTLSDDDCERDVLLWEHAERVARTGEFIASFASVAREHPMTVAVVAAALYHDAAWASLVRSAQADRLEVLTRSLSPAQREQSIGVMGRALHGMITAEALDRASEAIRTASDRNPPDIEARILADARSLEEFGLVSLWASIRRATLEGKGIHSALISWQRKEEYCYFTARLDGTFHFPEIRAVAAGRLERLRDFMSNLEREHRNLDLGGESGPTAAKPELRPASSGGPR